MKKFLAVILALAMIFALGITALADTTYTISAPSGDTHTYEVYQIFTGDLSGDVLSNVKWGTNGTGTTGEAVPSSVFDALEAVKDTSNQTKLAVIKNYVDLNSTPVKTGLPAADLPAGYYLIKDAATPAISGEDAYTTFIVKVVDDVTITRKAAQPTHDKQVADENNDGAATGENATAVNNGNGWFETADHAINESFQFKLTAKLPDDTAMDDYEHYYLAFEDIMGTGVTFESIEEVKVNDTVVPVKTGTAAGYTCTATAGQVGDGSTAWTIEIMDLKNFTEDLKNATITVVYNAHLNESAEITNASTDSTANNQNKSRIEFSNNPNATGNGETKPENTGKTQYDIVFVFTYEVDNTKYANEIKNENLLSGAGFKLYSDAACSTEISLIWDDAMSAYRPVKGTETKEELFSGHTETQLKGAESASFNIKGLDAGTYYLKETTTPAGYNDCPVIEITIGADHEENSGATNAAVTLTKKSKEAGSEDEAQTFTTNDVINNSGSTLPETGGIGTTIFYIIGGLLVVGAVILLVTKKRMHGVNE